jgi:hypothetical protein
MHISSRFQFAIRAALIHLLFSIGVSLLAAWLVFGVWYPFPYRELSGGRELFLLIISVDVVCGPLLTLVLFNPLKPRAELTRDLGLVVIIQVAALGYGIWTVWQARPLFIVQEVDRFKVIAAPDLEGTDLKVLPPALRPGLFGRPIAVAIRLPRDETEREMVLMESVQGGRDYSQRPEFYLPYEGDAARRSLNRAKPLAVFLEKRPEQKDEAVKLAIEKKADISQWRYLPVVARQDWIAILDKQGQIQGFLKGDGF